MSSTPRSMRLPYLDGLRALAAGYVVVFHSVLGFASEGLTGAWRGLKVLTAFGHEAVAIFIVLSGYCLMLPVARTADARLAGGFGGYILRRAFRILPPYFAALLISCVLIAVVPALREAGTKTIWDASLPGLALAPIAAHALLIHNWFPEWVYQINGPLWSVATEWQLYFLFPLLLLPLWRRFGFAIAMLAALAFGYAPLWFTPERALVAGPWYLALFALGMQAAAIGFSARPLEAWLRERLPWSKISAALWLACGLGGTVGVSIWMRHKPPTDLLVGIAAAALLVDCTRRLQTGRAGPLLRLLESRPLLAVGHFSYSLYLIHLPVVALCYFALRGLQLPQPVWALSMLAAGAAASLTVAYAFYLAVERHFLNARRLFGTERPRAASRIGFW